MVTEQKKTICTAEILQNPCYLVSTSIFVVTLLDCSITILLLFQIKIIKKYISMFYALARDPETLPQTIGHVISLPCLSLLFSFPFTIVLKKIPSCLFSENLCGLCGGKLCFQLNAVLLWSLMSFLMIQLIKWPQCCKLSPVSALINAPT